MKDAMEQLRIRLDDVDRRLLADLRERQEIVREIGRLKAAHNEPIVQPERARQVYQARREQGEALELDPDFVEAIWRVIHDESCRQQALVREALEKPDELESP